MGNCFGLAPRSLTWQSGEPEKKTGTFKKQGHWRKNWQVRFFVLEAGVLEYFEGCDDGDNGLGKPKGTLAMQNYTIDASQTRDLKIMLEPIDSGDGDVPHLYLDFDGHGDEQTVAEWIEAFEAHGLLKNPNALATV